MKKRYIILLSGAILLCLFCGSGYRASYIATGSMEPALKPGDLIITEQTTVAELSPGDIILYSAGSRGSRRICHRIVSITADGSIITKGDANASSDPPVKSTSLQLLQYRIPFAGYPFAFLQNRSFLISLTVSSLLMYLIIIIIRKKE